MSFCKLISYFLASSFYECAEDCSDSTTVQLLWTARWLFQWKQQKLKLRTAGVKLQETPSSIGVSGQHDTIQHYEESIINIYKLYI